MCRTTYMDVIGHNSGVTLKLTYETNDTQDVTENRALELFEQFRQWKMAHDTGMKFLCVCFFEPDRRPWILERGATGL